ncbi:MAG: tautomerase family protein [Novosphingobium sp.]
MPHVIVKLWPGRSEEAKLRLSQAILESVKTTLDYGDDAISIGFEEIAPTDWEEGVFKPDILGRWDSLTKQPGYGTRP